MNFRYKVLIADDSEASLMMMREFFVISEKEIDLLFARNGQEALDLVMEHKPDLILLDVIMPEINGIELVKKFKADPEIKDTPVIILSATESLRSAYESGANDFISKPFNQHELLIKVRSALNLIENIRRLKLNREELIEQKEQVEERKKEIIDDITYSKRIQQAILPSDDQVAALVKNHFLLNLPRNIVSGDFYWVGENCGRKVIVIADCTGHGISGAFMTMAGTVFLNEVIQTDEKLSSSEVLNRLRHLVMSLLKQKGETGEASDGLDISLIIHDKSQNQIEFSGANNPLYIIRNNELVEYKGDRMPIGIHLNFQSPFTTHTIPVQANDRFYMFSDGYADQFGGPKNKKFRYKQFRELLLSNHLKPFPDQKRMLHDAFIDWKGEEEQVDDILIMGFELS